jgi:hypothetical protein
MMEQDIALDRISVDDSDNVHSENVEHHECIFPHIAQVIRLQAQLFSFRLTQRRPEEKEEG